MLSSLYTDQKTPDVLIGDYNPPSTVLFIAVGIACAIVFLLLINSSRRFRENVFRALLRPYNFYADIRDQRILSNVQTTILGLVISITFALIVASLCYYYRMDEGFDATLSAIVTSDLIKEFLNYIVWRPTLAVIVFTVFFFVLMVGVAFVIRLCAAFVRNRIFFSDAYIIAVWGALPVLLLIIPAMILYRALGVGGAGMITFSVMMLVVLWMIYRVLRGTAVIYDVRPLKVYGYALGTIVALLIVVIVTSGETSATLSYLREGIGGLYSGR
jgi:MFS family permease